jgi:hypothetical protein
MRYQAPTRDDVIDLNDIPLDRRTERLEHAFQLLSPGETLWIAGQGDAHRYEHFLQQRFPGEVSWIADHDLEGRWIARVDRR